jgi:hypothetical protein
MKWKGILLGILLIGSFTFLFSGCVTSQSSGGTLSSFEVFFPNNFRRGSEPDGFRDIKWGTDISALSNMEYVKTDPSFGGVEVYKREGDKLQIGSAKIEKTEYSFWQNKFASVTILTLGYVNWNGLKGAIFEKFGRGRQSNPYIEYYTWWGRKTEMSLKYNEFSFPGQQGEFFMSSVEISTKAQKWEQGFKVVRRIFEKAEGICRKKC